MEHRKDRAHDRQAVRRAQEELFEYPIGDEALFPVFTDALSYGPGSTGAQPHSRNGADVFPFDPNGSYTGVPDTDPNPVQDADDL